VVNAKAVCSSEASGVVAQSGLKVVKEASVYQISV